MSSRHSKQRGRPGMGPHTARTGTLREAIHAAAAADPVRAYQAAGYPGKLKVKGGNAVGLCPFHAEKTPSFNITRWGQHAGTFKCFGCEAKGDLIAFYQQLRGGGLPFPQALEELAQALGVPAAPAPSPREHPPDVVKRTSWRIVDPTTDEEVATHERLDFSDGSKSFVWRLPGAGKAGLDGLKTADLPLYRPPGGPVPEPGEVVVVVEGEKTADSLAARGVAAWGTVTGAGNPIPGDAALETLRPYHVVLWPDNDPAGRRHMDAIAERLVALGMDAPRVVAWPEAPDKGDAADFAGNREALLALLESAQPWVPTVGPPVEPGHAEASIPPAAQIETALREPTDAGNAALIAALYGDRLRYDHPRGRWLVWGGHWWQEDADGEVLRLALQAAHYRFEQAWNLPDEEAQRKAAKAALVARQHHKLSAALAIAKAMRPIADAGEWDTDPALLGVVNGVVNLRRAELLPGHSEQRITRHIPVAYNPQASCPRWERFLLEVCDGREDLAEYVRIAAGYSLTAETSEQVLFVLHGPGGTGKSTFIGTLIDLAGPYGWPASFEAFEDRPAHSESVANLAGARIVTSIETRENTRLHEQRLKAVAHGNDWITASRKHCHEISFKSTAKLWLGLNHKPKVIDDSTGFWRSVRLLPFERKFDPQDEPDLERTLTAERPGILAWAVRAARDWYARGLPEVDVVQSATAAWERAENSILEWLETRCVVAEGCEATAIELWCSYLEWCAVEKIVEREQLTRRAFANRVTARFGSARLVRRGAEPVRVYSGVGVQL